jgi:hypothetical protein
VLLAAGSRRRSRGPPLLAPRRRRRRHPLRRGVPPQPPPLRSPQILETKTENPELVACLATLSEFYDDNSPAARRGLRSAIERRGLSTSRAFLGAAEAVIGALDGAQATLDALAAHCQHVGGALHAAKAATGAAALRRLCGRVGEGWGRRARPAALLAAHRSPLRCPRRRRRPPPHARALRRCRLAAS